MRHDDTRWILAPLIGLTLVLTGCPEDPSPPPSQDTEGQDSDGDQCDPVGADAQMGMLINAPVEADVEVIIKEPQHPGPAGPADLP